MAGGRRRGKDGSPRFQEVVEVDGEEEALHRRAPWEVKGRAAASGC